MAKTTILFGALLTLLGLITYFGAESLGASKRAQPMAVDQDVCARLQGD